LAGAALLAALAAMPAWALNCPAPPDQASANYAAQAKGQLAKLGPLTGASLDLRFQKASQNLYAAYPHADRLVVVQAVLSGACQIIAESKMTDERKFDLWMQATREAQKIK
jgi:hypothetical protein